MLETIREFAGSVLGLQVDTLGRRHAEFLDGFVRRMDAELRGDHDDVVLDVLAWEHDNVRAALGWSLENDPSLGMRLALAMERFWWMRGPVAEAERWFTALLERRDVLTPALVAGGLTERAWIAGEKGDWGRALEDGEEARRLAEQLGDDDIGYRALAALAEAYGATGRYADADAAYEEARALARSAGNKYREGATLYNQGQFAHRQGDLDRARVLTERSLVLAREVGTDEGVAGSLMALGALLREEGRYQESLEKLRFALTEAIRIGFPGRSAVCLFEVAAVLVRTGRAEQAAVLVAAAEQVFENEGIEPDPLGGEVMAQLRALGDESLDRLMTTGRAMDLEVAVDYALASID
jgi:non-specific serine/threonine protein kinase